MMCIGVYVCTHVYARINMAAPLQIKLPSLRIKEAHWTQGFDGQDYVRLRVQTDVSPSSVCNGLRLYNLKFCVQVSYKDAYYDLKYLSSSKRVFHGEDTSWEFSMKSDYRRYEHHQTPMYDIWLAGTVDGQSVKSDTTRISADRIKEMCVQDYIRDHICDRIRDVLL